MTETHEFVEREGRPTAEVWEIPRKVWLVLMSWGMAVVVIATLLSFWIYSNQRKADEQRDRLRLQQDRAMCAMIDVFLGGPEAPAGPTGDRSRAVRTGMLTYQATLQCDRIGSAPR